MPLPLFRFYIMSKQANRYSLVSLKATSDALEVNGSIYRICFINPHLLNSNSVFLLFSPYFLAHFAKHTSRVNLVLIFLVTTRQYPRFIRDCRMTSSDRYFQSNSLLRITIILHSCVFYY